MNLTKEKTDTIKNIALELAMGAFLADWNNKKAKEEIIEELEEGKDKNVEIWEPLENFDTKLVAGIIDAHYRCSLKAIVQALETIHPEDDLSGLLQESYNSH